MVDIGSYTKYVAIYDYDAQGGYTQKARIQKPATSEFFSASLSISSDGNILAIGDEKLNTSVKTGQANIYEKNDAYRHSFLTLSSCYLQCGLCL